RPDSRYFALLAQAQWLHRIGPRAGLIYVRVNWQDASDALLPMEKYAIGGWYSVRGYRRTQFVRDNAWDSSVEYRMPLLRVAFPGLSRTAEDGRVYAAAFFDAGQAWNEDESGTEPDIIYGAGPGLRWDINRGIRAELYWGALRRDIGPRRGDIQDDGIHFSVSVRQPF
ncbi:MAG: BamA/TamA family outer membrane protein, partial [Gammaproteobacteria bacterium]